MGRNRRRFGAVIAVLAIALVGAACGPKAPAAPACAGPGGPPDAVSATIYNRVNSDRAGAGLGPLSWNDQLYCLAVDWSTQLGSSGAFHHRDIGATLLSPEYSGWHTLGENIFRGPASLDGNQIEDAWMNSSPHRANILSGAFHSIGIGLYYAADGRVYATQNFGG
jgi:uncharacterized protein YkwD